MMSDMIVLNDYSQILDLLKENNFREGFVIFFMVNEIVAGKIENFNILYYDRDKLDVKYLLKGRIFNKGKEIYLYSFKENMYRKRIIDDENNNGNIEYIDAEHKVWGNRVTKLNDDWIKLEDNRGIKLILPLKFKSSDTDYFIKTRNYIGFNEVGQAGFIDSRFVDFTERRY
ncbi:CRISPR-associated protein, TIGR03984 family [Caldanaerobius fijiensis DSM 17918]|uniref:CRISPR-associated protein, TIGR03984 family n=1 Tax=Caldanaerobius fijiensis DSM 17918 TaxID=1121256 RepID=A0A1M5BSB8_9THEO|nr:CRISPR-associated protein Csx19 [Caldanaerobius fijiensis]SHF45132.1 CRISPR-associated protein, TIGR03984 family [Caldanaerobius fijiensis DSM 17918]